ncbi:MAG: zf-HC2 domain-containing protein [Rhodothermales bacterium]
MNYHLTSTVFSVSHWTENLSHCFSEELVELLILAPQELDAEDRANIIAHVATCGSCRQIASLLAHFYRDFLNPDSADDTPPPSRFPPVRPA